MQQSVSRPHSRINSPSDSDDKGQFGLRWHIVVSHFASHTSQADLTPVQLLVLLVVLLGPLVDQFPGHLAGLHATKIGTPLTS